MAHGLIDADAIVVVGHLAIFMILAMEGDQTEILQIAEH
jgi:hypothetical protein